MGLIHTRSERDAYEAKMQVWDEAAGAVRELPDFLRETPEIMALSKKFQAYAVRCNVLALDAHRHLAAEVDAAQKSMARIGGHV